MEVSTLMTDHNWVHFGISVLKPSWPTKELSYRKLLHKQDTSIILDKHAPILTKAVRVRSTVP